MKITISLKERHLGEFLKHNKLLKEVIDDFREHKSCYIQICTQDYAIDCEKKRRDFFINFTGDDE